MADRTLAIAFAPAGSTAEIHTGVNPDVWVARTDDNNDGYTTFQIDDSLGDSDIRITAGGFKPYQVHFHFRNQRDNPTDPHPLNQQVNVGSDIPALIPEGSPLPPAPGLPSLQISGRNFVDGGQRTVLVGTDAFLAFRQYLNGMDLTPIIRESLELGFNLWRVFFQGSIAQNGVLQLSPTEPGYYDHVRPFADLLNANGIVLLATIGVDNQDIQSPPSHWEKMYSLLNGTRTIISKGNEFSKNGWNPGTTPNPIPGQVWSQGSDVGDAAPFRPESNLVFEFHPVRVYTTAMRDTVASPIELYEVQGYHGVMLIDEPARMGTNASATEFGVPQHCAEYARLTSTLCGGVVFHNWFGQRGLLMDALTRQCAQAFVAGMRFSFSQPFKPAPRVWKGNMCGVRVAGLPAVAGGANDPSLVLSWFIDRYSPADRQRIYDDWKAKGLTHVLVSWPDAQQFGHTPAQFAATCTELLKQGFYPAVFLSAKPTSSNDIRSVPETIANIQLVLPLLVGKVPIFCIGWELSLWLSPTDVQTITDAIAPQCLKQPGTRVYVHFQERYMSFPQPDHDNASYWLANIGKLTGVLLQRVLGSTDAEYLDWLNDCLERAAGNFGMPATIIDGHGVDLVALELDAQDQFNGGAGEAEGIRLGKLALNAPAVDGPAGHTVIMGVGNG